MDTDEVLKEILEKGIEVKDKLPDRYYKKRLYYKIFARIPKKNCFVIEIERKVTDSDEEIIKFRIVEVMQVIATERKHIQSRLIYTRMFLEPYKSLYVRKPGESKYKLNGKLYLPIKSETRF